MEMPLPSNGVLLIRVFVGVSCSCGSGVSWQSMCPLQGEAENHPYIRKNIHDLVCLNNVTMSTSQSRQITGV